MKYFVYACLVFVPPLFNPWSDWWLDKPLYYTPYPVDSIFRMNGKFYQTGWKPWELHVVPDNWAKMG